MRHNRILKLLIDWMSPKLKADAKMYHDLSLPNSRHISDLFNNVRPDIAINLGSKIVILELTICHETNMLSSRNYKIDKYKNIHQHKAELIQNLPVTVCTCEVSVLGFVVIEPKFLSECSLPEVDNVLLNNIMTSAINSSFEIYADRNT